MKQVAMTRLELFSNLGYRVDPFKGAKFDSADSLRVKRILAMAIESRAMVCIVGPRGIGKTEAIDAVLDKSKLHIVTVEKSDKAKVTIGDIEMAMVLDLDPSEAPKGGERLSRQLRPILGTKSSGRGKVVLVIEEAQRLHASTLKSLKTLREKSWMGEKELFTVVLVAQSDPMARPGLSEVRLRTDCVHMQGLSATEAAGYVGITVGKHFEPAAIEALAELPASGNFLELQEMCVAVLSHALALGRELVTVEDVQALSMVEKKVELPRGAAKQHRQAVSPKEALQAVKDRRGGAAAVEQKEAAVC